MFNTLAQQNIEWIHFNDNILEKKIKFQGTLKFMKAASKKMADWLSGPPPRSVPIEIRFLVFYARSP